MRGLIVLAAAMVSMVAFIGCSFMRDSHPYPRPFHDEPIVSNAPVTPSAPHGMTGVWRGISSADCIGPTIANPGRCGATQKITLTMLQDGDSITGYYACAYGNEVCRNLDETGRIRDGVMIGRRMELRVMLEDGSMCFFTGIPRHDVMEGRYSCLQGAGLVERGAFHAERSY